MSLEDDILIERFLRNELSNEEKETFLKRVETDEAFKEYFTIEKELFESFNEENWSFVENVNSEEIQEYTELFRSEEANSLQKTLSEVNKVYKEENQSKKRRLFYISGVAATILLLVTLNIFNGNNSSDYYNEYIMLNELPSFTSRGEASDKANLISAENYFKEKKYNETLSSLEQVSNPELKDGNYYLYKAISLIELNNYSKAEKTLDLLINSDLIDAPKGHWYKALLYVKSKQLTKAKEELNILLTNTSYKQKEAKELLEKLE